MFKTITSLPKHLTAVICSRRSHHTHSYRYIGRIITGNYCNIASTLHHPRVTLATVSQDSRYVTRRHYSVNNKDIYSILHRMPKEVNVKELQRTRLTRREKLRQHRTSTVYLQVLGSGAPGAPRSLLVFTDQAWYLFNCGEGAQRLANEHKVKLGKVEHVLVTHKSWENVGGLLGMLLTLQDMGVPDITLHGPPGLDSLYYDAKKFTKFSKLALYYKDYGENGGRFGSDNDPLYIWSVPLWAKGTEAEDSSCVEESSEEVGDLYAHEGQGSRQPSRQSPDVVSACPKDQKTEKSHPCRNLSMAYICRTPPKDGKLSLVKCVKAGVPGGPLLGDLKKGLDVTLPNGNVVRAVDVKEPDIPGMVFIVVEAPTEQYLDALLENESLAAYQSGATSEDVTAEVVVHFTPVEVVNHPRYQEWMARFPTSTSHIFINENNTCMGSQAVHRIQYKLNHLDDSLFPLLSDKGIPIRETSGDENENEGEIKDHTTTDGSRSLADNGTVENGDKKSNGDVVMKETTSDGCVREVSGEGNGLVSDNNTHSGIGPTYQASTLLTYHLLPKKKLERSSELSLEPQTYLQECYAIENFESSYQQLKSKLDTLRLNRGGSIYSCEDYPNVTFLGTGSCLPSKTRNTSGILLNLSRDKCVMMDCGEGTYGQLVRILGVADSDLALRQLKAVYVSHLHADHHTGFIRLLQARRKAFQRANIDHVPKLILLAPSIIMGYLTSYHNNFEPILNDFTLHANHKFLFSNASDFEESYSQVCSELDMKAIDMTYVIHCPNAFGVAWTHKDGWKMVYSGDTMPCKNLIEIGMDCDLLIHEATMEDELEEDARIKTHCTTSQAIQVGQEMKAKFTLLTHFSQRYAKVPLMENINDQVGIAFDNMRVSLKALPALPLMNDALVAMFAEYYDVMLERTAKRRAKRNKMEDQTEEASIEVKRKQLKVEGKVS